MKWQAVLDLARMTLNDDDKDKNTDADLLVYGNDAAREVYGLRPDLRLGSFGTAYTEATDPVTDNFTLPDDFKRIVADYIVARAEFKDAVHVTSGRAVAAFGLFKSQVVSA